MYLMGSWEIQTIEESYPDFNYGITYYPKFSESSKVVSPSGDWCFGITSGSENQEAAAKLLEFLTSAEEVEEYCSAISKPPARISVFDNMEEYQDENISAFYYKKMKYIYKFKKNGYNTNSYKMSVSMSTRLLTDKNWRSEYEGTDGYPIWKDFNR